MQGIQLLLHSSAVSALSHWRLLEITGNYWRLLTQISTACTPLKKICMQGMQLLRLLHSSVRGVEEGIIPNHKAAGSPQPH